MVSSTVISQTELGNNCQLPIRFLDCRCPRVMRCSYPEKANCKAVDAEMRHIRKQIRKYEARKYGELNKLVSDRKQTL